MKEILTTKGQYAIVDDEDFDTLNASRWYLSPYGYAARTLFHKGVKKTELMHRIIMRTPKGMEIDHISMNRLDNRKENLRIVERCQNAWNRKVTSRSKSGIKGVSFDKSRNKWVASLMARGAVIRGRFNTQKEAIDARRMASLKYHGEFANGIAY